jgi:hypothetical protein
MVLAGAPWGKDVVVRSEPDEKGAAVPDGLGGLGDLEGLGGPSTPGSSGRPGVLSGPGIPGGSGLLEESGGLDPLRPVWLLDVDGVLNASHPGWNRAPVIRTAFAGEAAFRLCFAPALIRRIRAVHECGAVEVRWATTWVDHIDQVIRVMRLPRWACAFNLGQDDANTDAAKYAAALHVVETERRPLIWTDDEAIPAESSRAYCRLRSAGPRVLLIRPCSSRGLQPEHLDQIHRFLAG